MIKYTCIEGGEWKRLERSMRTQQTIRQLKKSRYKDKLTGFTISRLTFHQVHSVMFNDGRIWDSAFNNYRGTQ